MTTLSGETFDNLSIGDLKIFQSKSGYRFSIDPVLLSSFTRIVKDARVLDLGTGNGIIPLLLAARGGAKEIVGVELQPEMVERARRTVRWNKLESLIQIVQADIRALPENICAGSWDVVTCNPPYRTQDSGRHAKGDERSRARHELAGGLVDFLRAAQDLLKPGGGLFIVYLPERLPELMAEMRCFRLEPKHLRMVHSRAGDDARLVLVEARKNAKPGLTVGAPLVIYKGEGRDYSEEVLAMYQ